MVLGLSVLGDNSSDSTSIAATGDREVGGSRGADVVLLMGTNMSSGFAIARVQYSGPRTNCVAYGGCLGGMRMQMRGLSDARGCAALYVERVDSRNGGLPN